MGFSLRWLHLLGAQALGCAGFSSLQLVGSVVGAHGLWNTDSALVPGVSCSVACGIVPDRRSNPCLLHWQVHSLPLSHRESPVTLNFYFNFILMKSNSMGSFPFGFFFSTWFWDWSMVVHVSVVCSLFIPNRISLCEITPICCFSCWYEVYASLSIFDPHQ